MSNFNKILGGTAVALTLIAGATQASAALVTQWGYTVDSGWSAFSPAGAIPNGVEGSSNNTVAPHGSIPTVLSWGEGDDGPSTLSVTPTISNPPTLFTNGAAVAGATVTHDNNVIGGNDIELETATLSSALLLTPLVPPGSDIGPIPVSFDITFDETANAEPCTPDSTGVPCDDIFVLLNPEALSFQFELMKFLYTVELILDDEDFGVLSDEACAAAGAESGCVGFLTQEGEFNVLNSSFRITARHIPEPSTLALLGLGLIGLGFARRRMVAA